MHICTVLYTYGVCARLHGILISSSTVHTHSYTVRCPHICCTRVFALINESAKPIQYESYMPRLDVILCICCFLVAIHVMYMYMYIEQCV